MTAREIGAVFGYKARSAAALCQRWVDEGFLEIADPARKSRTYRLAEKYEAIIGG